jgi:hypothetical protein
MQMQVLMTMMIVHVNAAVVALRVLLAQLERHRGEFSAVALT